MKHSIKFIFLFFMLILNFAAFSWSEIPVKVKSKTELNAGEKMQFLQTLTFTSPFLTVQGGIPAGENFGGTRYGARLSLHKKTFPLAIDLYCGTLSYSGSITRLKSLTAKTASPLSSLTLPKMSNSVVLPEASSSRQNISFSMNVKTNVKTGFFIKNIQIICEPETDYLLSLDLKSFNLGKTKFNFAATFGEFFHGPKSEETWFLNSAYYKEKYFFAGEFYSQILNDSLRSATSLCFIENPYSYGNLVLRTWDTLLLGQFTLKGFFTFAQKNTVFTRGTSSLNPVQFFINPQYDFCIKNSLLSAGLLFLQNRDFTDGSDFLTFANSTSLKTSVKYSINSFSIFSESALNIKHVENENTFSQKLNASFFYKVPVSMGGTFSFNNIFPSQKNFPQSFTVAANINILPLGLTLKKTSVSCRFEHNAKKNTFFLEDSISFAKETKYLVFQCKMSVCLKFLYNY